jgi:hypothetical protein
MQVDVANSPVKLLPYSGLIMLFSNMQSMAKRLGLKETDLSADEPVFYDTGLGRVALIKGVVSFSGAHESLCIMAESMIDSPCLVESLSVSKDKGTLSVSFSLFGIDES